jgi:hypothetical protein
MDLSSHPTRWNYAMLTAFLLLFYVPAPRLVGSKQSREGRLAWLSTCIAAGHTLTTRLLESKGDDFYVEVRFPIRPVAVLPHCPGPVYDPFGMYPETRPGNTI